MVTPPDNSDRYMVSQYTSFSEPVVKAHLYNPAVDETITRYPFEREEEAEKWESSLTITGNGLKDSVSSLVYRIETKDKTLYENKTEVTVENGWFEKDIHLHEKFPGAEGVSWELARNDGSTVKGCTPLSWSRFRGEVKRLDEERRSMFITLWPITWGSPGSFTIPIPEDGHFDVLVPERVYAVMNVNDTGYSYDSMERWAWDYDLTRDRTDEFVIGRTELYGMRAFDINGGPRTIFIIFRPTALSRILRFDADGDGFVRGEEQEKQEAAMKESPTVIGPELKAEDVRVWLNDKEEPIVQFDLIPECDGDHWQVQYLLQIFPESKPVRGVWHEIRVEVESKEHLRNQEVIDFGQGSVGFYRP